jgi:hypothetical protein
LSEIETHLKAAVISESTGEIKALEHIVELRIKSLAQQANWCDQVYPSFEHEDHYVLPTNINEEFNPIAVRFNIQDVSEFCYPVFTLQVLNPFTNAYEDVLGL